MTKCPKHPQRRRKDCSVCNGPEPTTFFEQTTRIQYPHVTEDGMSWLDPNGNPPKLDKDGKLAEPFTLELAFGALERWSVGLKLPDTPEAFRRFKADMEAMRARIHHKKEKGG